MRTLLIATAALAAAASSAWSQAPAAKQCFSTREISNTKVVDDSTINFGVGSRIYQAKMGTPCPRLKDSFRGFTLKMQGSDQICGALDLNIRVNDIAGGYCMPKTLRQLSPAEVAALPVKEKP